MVDKTVYLAGPISGLTYEEATAWREHARVILAADGIRCLSPLRAKIYLRDETAIAMDYPEHEESFARSMSNSRGITTRDRFDCQNCDLLLVNLLGVNKVSIGTMMEIAWADALRKPIVVLMEKNGNVHDHPMVNECTGFRADTLEEGLQIVRAILGDF